MKKICVILVVLLSLIATVGFAENIELSSLDTASLENMRNSINEELYSRQKAANAEEALISGPVGMHHVAIMNCRLSRETSTVNTDAPGYLVTLVFSNESEETKPYGRAVQVKVFQNGVQCKHGVIIEGTNNASHMLEVRPGGSIEISTGVLLYDTTNPVEIEVVPYMSAPGPSLYLKMELEQ